MEIILVHFGVLILLTNNGPPYPLYQVQAEQDVCILSLATFYTS